MLNIFATPGDVFDEVKASPATYANWLMPTILGVIAGIACFAIVFSQPAFAQRIREVQTKAFEQRVASGKMTQAQADQAEAINAKFVQPPFVIAISSISILFMGTARVFWLGLVLWLLGKWFFKSATSYQKALEVAGLSTMVAPLGWIVTLCLSMVMSNLTPLNLALLFPNADPNGVPAMAMKFVDVFDFWTAGLLTIGLAKLANVPWTKALIPILIYWLLMDGIFFLFGLVGIFMNRGFK